MASIKFLVKQVSTGIWEEKSVGGIKCAAITDFDVLVLQLRMAGSFMLRWCRIPLCIKAKICLLRFLGVQIIPGIQSLVTTFSFAQGIDAP